MVKWRGRHLSWHLPPLTTTPHHREDVSALDRFNVHLCPTRRVFSGTGLERVTRQATIRYLYHSATAVKVDSFTDTGEVVRGTEKQSQEGEVIAACALATCVDRNCNSQDLSSNDLVKDLLQNTDLDEKQRCAARELITEFQSLFSRTSEDFGRTRLTQHRIDTGEHRPIKQHLRRLPFAKKEAQKTHQGHARQ
ncbi:uncharacterized protein TNCV_4518111 [Trichonephila clavipes]|nr:uncharacterized protein TNCV_4518111 [Trichonephila clavipes]